MTKNFMIGALVILVAMLAIRPDPECENTDDPNAVVIEYQCSELDEYDNVPPEVVDECKDRAIQATVRNKIKT